MKTTPLILCLLLSTVSVIAKETKVSRPFEYSGYSEASYKSYTKKSDYVIMKDGTRIAVDIFLPAEGPSEGPFPAVFQFTPYGRAFAIPEKMSGRQKLKMKLGVGTSSAILDRANSHDTMYGSNDYAVRLLLSYGYAYVCGDVRGTGASFGVKVDFMPEIGTDGAQVIDWMAEQSWCDGNIGMFGGSYLGYSQLAIAAQRPAALKCIFPEVVAFDGYSSEIRPGGCFVELYSNQDLQRLYELNFYDPKNYIYPTAPVVDEDGDGDLTDEIPLDLNGNGTFLDDYDWPTNPQDEPRYEDGQNRRHIYFQLSQEHLKNYPYNNIGGLTTFIDKSITIGGMEMTPYEVSPSACVPAIMASGIAVYNHGSWMDDFTRGTFELYCTMEKSNPSKLIVDPGYHETWSPFWKYCNENEKESIKKYSIELLRFYDRWLKGIRNGIDEEPPIYIYNMNGDGWRFENEWPLKREVPTNYFLSADQTLSTQEPKTAGRDKYLIDLNHNSSFKSKWYDYGVSRWIMCEPDKLPYRTEMDKQCQTYTTGAFPEDLEVTGHPIVKLYASCSVPDADIHLYLEDVAPQGKALLVTEGVLKAGFASLYNNDNMIPGGKIDVKPELPWHGYEENQYNPTIFADSAIVELTIDMFPTSWVFKKGHQLRLSVACQDYPTFQVNKAVTNGSILTLWRDSEHPSCISIPVIPR